jgi:hypothetical protein
VNINESFPSHYLKASDLGTGSPVVTIARVEHEPVGREREMKAVLYFEGKEKGVVLNKTNARKITELVGSPETDEWAGFKIRIFATTTEFGGETVECIRVKAAGPANGHKPAPKAEPVAPKTELDDSDIPFAWVLPFILPAIASLSLFA